MSSPVFAIPLAIMKKCFMKRCSRCKISKHIEKFNRNSTKKDGLRNECKECTSKMKKEKKAYIYEFLMKHFKENPCSSCGETNPILLDFDHLRDKKISIANAITNQWSLERIQDEIDKCQVLCSNCHRMKTAKDHNWYMYKKLYGEQE